MSDDKLKVVKTVDPVTETLLKVAKEENISTSWDRLEEQSPQCGFGTLGVCCRICAMGPCQTGAFAVWSGLPGRSCETCS